MSAAMLLALTMLTHARHVIRDAEGLLPRRTVRPKATKSKPPRRRTDLDNVASETAAAQGDTPKTQPLATASSNLKPNFIAIDAAHGVPQPAAQKTAVTRSSPTPLAGGLGSSSTEEKLSKADKKALRKRLEESRRQREGG